MRAEHDPELDFNEQKFGAAMQSCGKGMAGEEAVSTQQSAFSLVTGLCSNKTHH
jgi:hypothetical protein